MYNVMIWIFVYEGWALQLILRRVLTSLTIACCQGQQGMLSRPYFIRFTAKSLMLPSLNHVSAIQCIIFGNAVETLALMALIG